MREGDRGRGRERRQYLPVIRASLHSLVVVVVVVSLTNRWGF